MLCNGTVGTISEDQHECLDIAREEVARLARRIQNQCEDLARLASRVVEGLPD